jgi:hypothetical protein
MKTYEEELAVAIRARLGELKDLELADLLESHIRQQPYFRNRERAAEIAGFEERLAELSP